MTSGGRRQHLKKKVHTTQRFQTTIPVPLRTILTIQPFHIIPKPFQFRIFLKTFYALCLSNILFIYTDNYFIEYINNIIIKIVPASILQNIPAKIIKA